MALRVGSVGLGLEAGGTDLDWLNSTRGVGRTKYDLLVEGLSYAREGRSAGD